MVIEEIDEFIAKIKKLLENLEDFCSSIEFEDAKSATEGTANE